MISLTNSVTVCVEAKRVLGRDLDICAGFIVGRWIGDGRDGVTPKLEV